MPLSTFFACSAAHFFKPETQNCILFNRFYELEQPAPCAQPKQDGSLPPPPPYLPPPPLLFTCSLTFSPFRSLCLHPFAFERLQIGLFFYFATPQITPKLVQAVLFIYFICPSDVLQLYIMLTPLSLQINFILPVGLKTVRRNQTQPVDFGMNFLMLAFHKI